MSSIAKNVFAARAENRPPMQEKGNFDTWQSRMLLCIEGKEHVEMLLDSILKGPFEFKVVTFPTNEATRRPAETRMHTLKDLTPKERIRKEYDIRAANIILHGLPNDIYTLESTLADEFERFTSEKGQTIQSYYMRYPKLMNDINIIRLKMTTLQVNTKFVNHLQPEWSRFVTGVKQAKNLYEMLLTQQQEAGIETDAEQQDFLADGLEGFDSDCEDLQLNVTSILMTDKVDTYDSEVDDAPTTSMIFMAKVSPTGSFIGDEVGPSYD
ncbi:hypothetical protein Tco_0823770 [Tanacetum coccineum]|uniref:Integrase, catalytic region, zinc finger, CCHC-type, peptidase aspartic, catalytic n=1 Tax=Tanacetum coccineum TaxID=301880 RepID=A0ABQ5AIT0_9ASTR